MSRPRLPTSLKKLRGTLQPCRTNRTEPKPEATAPEPPANLSVGAAQFWPSVTATLTDMRVIAASDGVAVCALCETLADLAAARDALAKQVRVGRRIVAKAGSRTYTTTSKAGATMIRVRPEVAMIADADRRLMAWLARFGLSPADRSRVSEIVGTQPNPFLRFGKPPARDSLDAFLATDPDAPTESFDAFLASKPRPGVPSEPRRHRRVQ